MTLLDNQIGYADESVYGTRVAPTRFLEFNSEELARKQNIRASAGLRKANKVQRSDRQSLALKGADGAVEHDLAFTGFGLLLKHLFGAAPTLSQPDDVGAPTVWDQTFILGDGLGLSLTVQVGRPSTAAGVVQPFDYTGTKVLDGTFSQDLDDYAKLALSLDAQSEDDTQTLATASYPTAQTLAHDGYLAITVNGTPFLSNKSSFKLDRQLITDRYFQRASTLKKEPLRGGLAALTGSLTGEFEDLTTFNLFKAGTVVPIIFDWVGPLIAGGLNYEVKITLPACRLDGPTPTTKKAGILDAETPFTVLYNGTDEPVTCLYRGTDTAI